MPLTLSPLPPSPPSSPPPPTPQGLNSGVLGERVTCLAASLRHGLRELAHVTCTSMCSLTECVLLPQNVFSY